jgi:small subunit ribosomal protein S20
VANHKSAKKRIRQSITRNKRNRYWRSTMRTAIKRVEEAIEEGEKQSAEEAMRHAQKIIARTASKGVIKKQQAQRRISRLMQRVDRVDA